jgi:hypothetical protein
MRSGFGVGIWVLGFVIIAQLMMDWGDDSLEYV